MLVLQSQLCRGVYFVWEFLYLPQFFLKPSTIQKKFLPSGQPVHIGGYSSIFVNWGGRKDKEFLVIFRKNKGILSACGQKFHWKLQFYINSYHNFVNISSNPTSKPYTFHNSFLIPSTQKFFIGDLRSPIFHKIYSPAILEVKIKEVLKLNSQHSVSVRISVDGINDFSQLLI